MIRHSGVSADNKRFNKKKGGFDKIKTALFSILFLFDN